MSASSFPFSLNIPFVLDVEAFDRGNEEGDGSEVRLTASLARAIGLLQRGAAKPAGCLSWLPLDGFPGSSAGAVLQPQVQSAVACLADLPLTQPRRLRGICMADFLCHRSRI
jgi:hypothetical protein